ncbi:hypothetical protein PPERSA_09444 [Pseudocohnilembus persalinus]|uniref:Uncharacterized protein n=1 Tax=Pseudocohnilembus persalinus TaxID=266149 RepID=A0A0V0QA17_PSEPJ|nr:hypothetical protein PPERSA_09444 [Pseudocohnilembus persalinus]|eukprot:KRW98919.1 hypothetical protein PPERSA_09444 [Pseudocohnilembus persalinus]
MEEILENKYNKEFANQDLQNQNQNYNLNSYEKINESLKLKEQQLLIVHKVLDIIGYHTKEFKPFLDKVSKTINDILYIDDGYLLDFLLEFNLSEKSDIEEMINSYEIQIQDLTDESLYYAYEESGFELLQDKLIQKIEDIREEIKNKVNQEQVQAELQMKQKIQRK